MSASRFSGGAQPLVRIGTRGSALATTQTGHAADALAAAGAPAYQIQIIRTEGDVNTGSLASLGGTGVFAVALRQALTQGDVDLAVHSLKDLPTTSYPGLTIAAVPVREDPRDALCARDGLSLEQLPEAAKIGTGSPRRAAQLLAARPDIQVVDIRGNVPTRLGRVSGNELPGPGGLDAVVLASSGLSRLGLKKHITDLLDSSVMLPAPGQGALALEVRTQTLDEDNDFVRALAAVDHQESRWAVSAERAVLARLEAGCAAPVGALAQVRDGMLVLECVVVSADGTTALRHTEASEVLSGEAACELGRRVGDSLLAQGAARLMGA